MLPKKNRADKKAIETIFKIGRFISSPNLTLKYLTLTPLLIKEMGEIVRISFIAPKTASKKAVVRNLLRRRGYSVLEKYLDQFPTGFVGAFILGKKSVEIFGGRRLARYSGNKTYNPILNLENEIKILLNKLNKL